MVSQRDVRIGFVLILAFCLLVLIGNAVGAGAQGVDQTDGGQGVQSAETGPDDPELAASGVTVVTTQGFFTGLHPGDRKTASIVVYDSDGRVVYENRSRDAYFDVDPVPDAEWTVEYVAAERGGDFECDHRRCSRNIVERVNVSTGDVTVVHSAVTRQWDTGRWHDVDRINETHLLVADIVNDRVYAVDVRTNDVTWQWNASAHYPSTSGGSSGDWTHVNDVELLENGQVMVSLRNLDQVAFVTPGEGIDTSLTLGSDDNYDVLKEQHNPDFIPTSRGGPAVLLADSENNRIIEYRRASGGWTASWIWRDAELQWPRDADRLPNGNTLITDSHGDRVIEISPGGTVIWEVNLDMPYEAERLGSGGESTNGYAAGTASNSTSVDTGGAPPAEIQNPDAGDAVLDVKAAFPSRIVNGLLFISPSWVTFTDLLVFVMFGISAFVWGVLEWRWSDYTIT